jgi:hypothetical protein
MHRHRYVNSAMGELLGEDDELAAKETLYRCLDVRLEYKRALFDHLSQRWQDLFAVKFEVLLYDSTSIGPRPRNSGDFPQYSSSDALCRLYAASCISRT